MRRKRIVFLILLLVFPLVLPADPALQSRLLAGLSENASRVKDMSARVNFRIRFTSLGLAFRVHGTLYFKAPDRVRLKLDDVPAFLSGHEDQVFRSADVMVGLPRNITQEYHVARMRQAKLEGGSLYLMELLPNEKRRVSKVYLWVDGARYTLPEVVFQYHDGTRIRIRNHYADFHKIYVVREMQTTYDLVNPGLEANVDAVFSHYRVNKGIPDAVFSENKSNT